MQIEATNTISPEADIVVALFDSKDLKTNPLFKSLPNSDRKHIEAAISKAKFSDKDTGLFYLHSDPRRRVLLVGLGTKKDWNRGCFLLASRRIVSLMKEHKIEEATVNLADLPLKDANEAEAVSLAVQNFLAAEYSFVEHKEEPKGGWPRIKKIKIYSRSPKKLTAAVEEGKVIGTAVNECRRLSNIPGGLMTPKMLAREALRLGKSSGVKVKILGETEMKKLEMEGVLGVASGSAEEPQFIIMEYGSGNELPLVFVGKGITFDSGGIDIKPSGKALDMKMDMSGGAAVIAAIAAISKLKIRRRVIGLIPAAENMPSGSSYRPGDILKTVIGKTIEVINTDAEGRIVLADALGYAQRYKPSLIVDVATLTGAAVTALGSRTNALFSNRENLLNFGKKVGDRTGDLAWPMPAWDEYDEEIKGTFGDVANSGKYYPRGGAITASVFLKQFVGNYPWLHLDIAPMMTPIDGQYLEKGATGTGVRFLIEIAKTFK